MERVTPAANAKPASKGIGEGFGTREQEEHGERTLARPRKLEKTRKNIGAKRREFSGMIHNH